MLREQGDIEEPRALFQMALDSDYDLAIPKAALNLGNLLRDQGDIKGARAAYQQAIESGNADVSIRAKDLLDKLDHRPSL
jgi:FimV-like protein